MSRSACLWVNVRTIRCDWSTWGLRWPSPEVLVDAASGRGDNYSIPDLAHDTRQKRTTALMTAMYKYSGQLTIRWDVFTFIAIS
jgi:hypothetical protein